MFSAVSLTWKLIHHDFKHLFVFNCKKTNHLTKWSDESDTRSLRLTDGNSLPSKNLSLLSQLDLPRIAFSTAWCNLKERPQCNIKVSFNQQ